MCIFLTNGPVRVSIHCLLDQFKDLEPFEDGFIEENNDEDDGHPQGEEAESNQIHVPGHKIPSRRKRTKKPGNKPGSGDDISAVLYP